MQSVVQKQDFLTQTEPNDYVHEYVSSVLSSKCLCTHLGLIIQIATRTSLRFDFDVVFVISTTLSKRRCAQPISIWAQREVQCGELYLINLHATPGREFLFAECVFEVSLSKLRTRQREGKILEFGGNPYGFGPICTSEHVKVIHLHLPHVK